MKTLRSLAICVALAFVVVSVRSIRPAAVAAQPRAAFDVDEATIAHIQTAITSGQTTCRAVVQAYVDRARAYNGVCTALVTPDGADTAPATGYVRAGSPLLFPTKTVKASTIFPDLDDYRGLPLDYGRMEPTVSDVRLLIEKRRESEEVAARRFVEENVLLVLVDGRDSHGAGQQHVRPPGRVTDLVDALSRSKRPEFNLRRQDRELVIVE
jgi:hypothetical protein